MSARRLPERPSLDHLKHQAKELLSAWRSGATVDVAAPETPYRLRDAQRAVAQQYGFDSWDALAAHVESISGSSSRSARRPKQVLDYDDPIPDCFPLNEPITSDVVRQLFDREVTAVRIGPNVTPGTLARLVELPRLRAIDFGQRGDIVDSDTAFLEAMPSLTAVSLARCGRISDLTVERLRNHVHLERINLQWTDTGDAAIAALAGKPALSRVLVGERLTDAGAARLSDFPALAGAGAPDALLAISSARGLTDEALEAIGSLDGVIALDVHMSVFGSPHYTARGVSHFRRMASLEELNFHGALAADDVLAEIALIPRLRWLHCQDPVSGDDGFVALGRCTTLENIASRVCRRMTARGFAALAQLPRLKNLGLGGPRLPDSAMEHLEGAQSLVGLNPIMFGDAAFEHIAKIPHLERLTNMYNRSTGDAATRHLRSHPTLVEYGAFGTQITDDSLRILAGFPRLEIAEFANCDFITDEGLRELAALPRLRRVSDGSCPRVTGAWLASMPAGVDARHDGTDVNYANGYRAETLIDYPDMPLPPDVAAPDGVPPENGGELSRLLCFGVGAAYVDDGLRLTVPTGKNPRWIGVITRDAFAVPCRLELVVRPVSEVRLAFAAHNRFIALDEHGRVIDRMPWFLKTAKQWGEAVVGEAPFVDGGWAHITVDFEDDERRLYVDGQLRHIWREDEAGVRGRIGIGVQRTEVTIRELRVTPAASGSASVRDRR